jgi:hypothetical protein
MASTYSTSLKLELIGNGEQSGVWGTTTNKNMGSLLEQAITGVQTITMVNADYTLTNLNGTLDEARNAVLVLAGTNSAVRQVIAPLVEKLYVVTNNTTGGYAVTIGGSTGSLISIPNGTTCQVYCDGTNFYSSQTGSAGNFTINGDLTYSGTLTGGTGVVNLGSGQVYKDASGNVGIGTASPASQLEILKSQNADTSLRITNSNAGASARANLTMTGQASNYQIAVNDTYIQNYTGSNLYYQWYTGGTEKMRLTSDGKFLIGTTTSPTNALFYVINGANVGFGIDSSGASDNNNKNGLFFQNDGNLVTSHSNSFPTGFFTTYQYGGAIAGYIQGTSAGASVAYTSVSDYRLKEDIAPMTGALDTVAKLKPVTYTWKANGTKADGFIAHELQEVLPNAVSGEKDAVNADGSIKPQGIDTSYVVATLTAAIQEQQATIKTLTARIETLEAK